MSQKNRTPVTFCCDFGNYCPILMILSALWTETTPAFKRGLKSAAAPSFCCRTTSQNKQQRLEKTAAKIEIGCKLRTKNKRKEGRVENTAGINDSQFCRHVQQKSKVIK